jgi:hypothetical protein
VKEISQWEDRLIWEEDFIHNRIPSDIYFWDYVEENMDHVSTALSQMKKMLIMAYSDILDKLGLNHKDRKDLGSIGHWHLHDTEATCKGFRIEHKNALDRDQLFFPGAFYEIVSHGNYAVRVDFSREVLDPGDILSDSLDEIDIDTQVVDVDYAWWFPEDGSSDIYGWAKSISLSWLTTSRHLTARQGQATWGWWCGSFTRHRSKNQSLG